MKVCCFVGNGPNTKFFVNTISEHIPVCLVIVYNKPNVSILEKIKKHGLKGSFEKFKDIISTKINIGRAPLLDYKQINQKLFGDKWRNFNSDLRIVYTDDINSEKVLNLMKEERIDIIVDHGTPIVKDHIIDAVPLTLNLHYGLSPYYRGGLATEWALLSWDPYNIGVTVHKLTNKIDGGDIYAQKRAAISENDSVYSINMQLTYMGTHIMINALKQIMNNQEILFHKQDFSRGYVILSKQWSSLLAKQIRGIESEGLIQKMLQKPSRREALPIVEEDV